VNICSLSWYAKGHGFGDMRFDRFVPYMHEIAARHSQAVQTLQRFNRLWIWVTRTAARDHPAHLRSYHMPTHSPHQVGSIRPWEIVRGFAPFRYKMLGQLAVIGRERGVTSILDLQSRAFLRGFLWQSVYLIKVPKCR
jgi:NADH dehydrogenase FAD-containing subunit